MSLDHGHELLYTGRLRGVGTVMRLALALFLVGYAGAAIAADDVARIEGSITKKGQGVAAVTVLINELKLTEESDGRGKFVFERVPLGTYTMVLSLGDETEVHPLVIEEAGTKKVEIEVNWEVRGYEEMTVIADVLATKVVDAPAAVTSIFEEQIEQQASLGQVPKLLEFTPGAEVTQSGLYDFNFNTRGFNSSLNRRVSTYIDGRDVGVVLLGAQEWASISGGLDDVAQLEFVRGPSAALYGANASSGVVNITTKAPRESLGGLARFTVGELNTASLDVRHAMSFGKGWYGKILAGYKDSGDYSISRNPNTTLYPEYSEYCLLIGETDCLPAEKTLFREQDDQIRFGALRVDKYLADDSRLTFEAGVSTIKGPVLQTGIGRAQILDATRPFYRFGWSNPHWNVMGHYTSRDGDQVNLVRDLIVGYELKTQEERYGVEAQGNWHFLADKLRFVAGAAYTHEHVDSYDATHNRQTVLYEPVSSHREAIFTQLDWSTSKWFKLVFAARVDASTLHDTQFSPKAAFVYNINSHNSVRLTYNRAFQVANYSEFFLHTNISYFPIGGFVRTICEGPLLPQPVDCGIDSEFVPILAVGNDDLDLEKTEAWELGYSGVVANRVFITLDYYRSKNKDFITDLVPQVGTILGNLNGCVDQNGAPITDPRECPINNDYKEWVSTDEAENTILFGTLTVAQALRNAVDNSVGGNTLGFRLAQDLNGDTVVVGRTYTNVGLVHTQGIDFGLQYFITKAWNLQVSYSWFDFEIQEEPGLPLEALQEILLPNTPRHKASVAVSMNKPKWSFSVGGRWVNGFRWSTGVFQGEVPDYTTYDVNAAYRFNDTVQVGLNVANAVDNLHRETFGGDNIYRRALLNLTVAW
jgi:outer membrane receptor protein involved in Fe transport